MNISVKTLGKRLPEIMEALDKNKQVTLSHEGKKIAVLHPVPNSDDEIQRIMNHPAVGMWADREDMKNPTAWVHAKRRRRRERLFETGSGEGK